MRGISSRQDLSQVYRWLSRVHTVPVPGRREEGQGPIEERPWCAFCVDYSASEARCEGSGRTGSAVGLGELWGYRGTDQAWLWRSALPRLRADKGRRHTGLVCE